MKKAMVAIKFLMVSFCWAIFLFGSLAFLLNVFWDFNIFNYKSWSIVAKWWQGGGIINSWQDFLFFFIILMFVPLLIIGIRRGMKINYLQLAVRPIIYLMNRGLDEAPQSVTIKNIDVTVQKTSKEEFINNVVDSRLKEIDENTPPEPAEKIYKKIRQGLAEKESEKEILEKEMKEKAEKNIETDDVEKESNNKDEKEIL